MAVQGFGREPPRQPFTAASNGSNSNNNNTGVIITSVSPQNPRKTQNKSVKNPCLKDPNNHLNNNNNSVSGTSAEEETGESNRPTIHTSPRNNSSSTNNNNCASITTEFVRNGLPRTVNSDRANSSLASGCNPYDQRHIAPPNTDINRNNIDCSSKVSRAVYPCDSQRPNSHRQRGTRSISPSSPSSKSRAISPENRSVSSNASSQAPPPRGNPTKLKFQKHKHNVNLKYNSNIGGNNPSLLMNGDKFSKSIPPNSPRRTRDGDSCGLLSARQNHMKRSFQQCQPDDADKRDEAKAKQFFRLHSELNHQQGFPQIDSSSPVGTRYGEIHRRSKVLQPSAVELSTSTFRQEEAIFPDEATAYENYDALPDKDCSLAEPILGSCQEMCPESEQEERECNRDIDKFECLDGSNHLLVKKVISSMKILNES